MLDFIIIISMVLEILALGGIILLGAQHVRSSWSDQPPLLSSGAEKSKLPPAAVIIPLTGNAPGMRECLQSLLTQDYPDYQVIFVTRDLEDPAVALLGDLLASYPRARHIISGPTRRRGQKNYNMLAGIAAMEQPVEYLVFCDSTHLAPPYFLSGLLGPLIKKEADLTTGFHRVVPGDYQLPTLGMAITVLTIHMLQGITFLTQPWGGAMAMSRKLFEAQEISKRWAETVVDDISLVAQIRRARLRVKPVPGATLLTPLTDQSWNVWINWLTRQLMYVKFCLPGTWLAAAGAAYLLIAPLLSGLVIIFMDLEGWVSRPWVFISTGYFIFLTLLGDYLRRLIPELIPRGPWLLAFYAAFGAAFWCYLKTWLTNIIAWRNISYRVTWGGRVKEVLYRS